MSDALVRIARREPRFSSSPGDRLSTSPRLLEDADRLVDGDGSGRSGQRRVNKGLRIDPKPAQATSA